MSDVKTELLIHPISARKWQVVRRPVMEGVIPQKDIRIMAVFSSKQLAVAFAEGRQSATGERIAVEP